MAEKKSSDAAAAAASKTPGSPGGSGVLPGSPSTPGGVSNDELLNSLQSRAQVFNQLWQAVEKVQGESISIATWKAKLKELEDAKLANRKLASELKSATGRNAELITHNAALMASREDLNRELGLRDGRIEGLGAQLAQVREEIQAANLAHQAALGKEQRARALTASELRDKVAALLSSQGQVTELVSELQSLKTELLRSKEVSRINSEGVRNELKAAQDHVKALEADKASISQHLWNVTDEIKKLAARLEQAETLAQQRLAHLEEARASLTDLQQSSAAREGELSRDVARLRDRNEELSDEVGKLRREKDLWQENGDAQQKALRAEIEAIQGKMRAYEEERTSLVRRADAAEAERARVAEALGAEVAEAQLKLSDERTAHREIRKKMEGEMVAMGERNAALEETVAELEAARAQQARLLDELRARGVDDKERIAQLERRQGESDLAMGSVRKKLEQHLDRARQEIRNLQAAADEANVRHAAEMEALMDRLRAAEEGLESHQESAKSAAANHAATSETLTAENFQLRETVGKQNAAIVAEREKSAQLTQQCELLRQDAEKEVASVQGELSRALDQAVKDMDKARKKNETQRAAMNQLETEKREILQEASKLNAELGTQLNEVKDLRQEVERRDETEAALRREIESLRAEGTDGLSLRRGLQQELEGLRRAAAEKDRVQREELESSRKELKLAQKEAAERVAKFSEHGRAMAADIERLTTRQNELVENLEQRETELKKMTANCADMAERIRDVKRLRSEVAGDLDAARQSLKEERANVVQLTEQKEVLMQQLEQEKRGKVTGEKQLKIAMRQQKKAARDVERVEKEKLTLQTALEREKLVAPPLMIQIREQQKEIAELDRKRKEEIVKRDQTEGKIKKQALQFGQEISELQVKVQNARDDADSQRKKLTTLEREAKDFETEAQKTVNELMRQLREVRMAKEREGEKLQQQVRVSPPRPHALSPYLLPLPFSHPYFFPLANELNIRAA